MAAMVALFVTKVQVQKRHPKLWPDSSRPPRWHPPGLYPWFSADRRVIVSLMMQVPVLDISRQTFDVMYSFARLMHRLKRVPAYAEAMRRLIPPSARFDPGLPSVLMGYDFHLTPDGPRLIEINNNAGGLYLGDGAWLPQPEIAEMPGTLTSRIISMFPDAWRHIAIMDEDVAQQYMYPEMQAYAALLEADGRYVRLVCPQDISPDADGTLFTGRLRLDAIYNRHTDFYLESEALSYIRAAYLEGRIALTPNPRSYALLGDKARMVDWHRPGLLESCLTDAEVRFVREIVPVTRLLAEVDAGQAWKERKGWVFKPAARHGGKGVLPGRAMSRRRFAQMRPEQTVMQRYVAPGTVTLDGEVFKFDVRLFTHGERLIAVAGRIWQGMVTNFRAPGSGWTALRIV